MKIILIVVLLLAIAGGGGLYFTGYFGGAAAEVSPEDAALSEAETIANADPIYLNMDPPFVVNFMHRGTLRYLQMTLELMFRDQRKIEAVNARMPEIRNDLIMLLSAKDFESLSTSEGKEVMRTEIMGAVDKVLGVDPATSTLKNSQGEPQSAVYITSFVMQ